MVGEPAELGIVDPLGIGIGQDRVAMGGPVPVRAVEGGLVPRRLIPYLHPARGERGAQAGDFVLEGTGAAPENLRLVRAQGTAHARTARHRPGTGGAPVGMRSKAVRRLILALLQNRPALASPWAGPDLRGGGR